MAYINTQTMQYPVSEQDIRNEYPNTSFTVPFQAPEQYAPVLNSPTPSFNAMTQGYREVAPVKQGNEWMQVFEVYELDPEQVTYNEEQAKQRNKQQAETLLKESDWTQYPDVTNTLNVPHLTNGDEWVAYRALVRAIVLNPPVEVTEWPTKPEELWSTTA